MLQSSDESLSLEKIIELYETSIILIILSCINELNFGVGMKKLVSILRGSKSSFVLKNKLYEMSSFALLKTFSSGDLQYIIRLMLERELLSFDYISRYGIEMPIISITENGLEYLYGKVNTSISFINYIRNNEITELNDVQTLLFERLRKIRLDLARENDIPPYSVCSDQVLWEICLHIPKNKEELLNIKGIGPAFIDKYSCFFLQCLQTPDNNLEPLIVEEEQISNDLNTYEKSEHLEAKRGAEPQEQANSHNCQLLKGNTRDAETNKYTCLDCLLNRNGTCFGEKKTCGFFKYVPTISKEEKENWPKYGDASAIRFGDYRRFND